MAAVSVNAGTRRRYSASYEYENPHYRKAISTCSDAKLPVAKGISAHLQEHSLKHSDEIMIC